MKYIFVLLISASLFQCANSGTNPDGESGDLEITTMFANPPTISSGAASLVIVKTNKQNGLTYRWSANLGYFSGSGSQVEYSASSCCIGGNTITCTVSDAQGNEVAKSVQILVR